jgi:putative membrane protein
MEASVAPLDNATKLAVDRTFLAHERTMMAWVRTAASMISFGFTIYKFFQLELSGRRPAADYLVGPSEFALILIATGVGSLVLATFEHRRSMQLMRTLYGDAVSRSIAGLVAGIVGALGVAAIVLVLLQQ